MRVSSSLFFLALVSTACTTPADDDTDDTTDDTDTDAETDDTDVEETDDTDEPEGTVWERLNAAAPGTILTIAGVPNVRALGLEGVPADQSEISLPVDMSYGPDGRVYLIDWNNHRLRYIDEAGLVHSFAGTGFLGDGPEGPAVDAAFNHPTNLDFHPIRTNELFVSAWHNSRINVVDMTTGLVRFEAGTGGRSYGGEGGPKLAAVLDLPTAISFEDDGSYYLADQASMIIRYVDLEGNITTVAGQPPTPNPAPPADCPPPCLVRHTGWAGDEGPASEALFTWSPNQAAYPGSRIERLDRTLYIADTLNHVVRTITLDDMIIHHFAGTGQTAGFSGDGGSAATAQLDEPADIAVASNGDVYIADTENHCVRKVDGTGVITTVAGQCDDPGYEGDNGPATSAKLFRPFGVEISPDGTVLLIADTGNEIIRAVKL